jgi:Holliday junction resolvase RusA-like endonuclease
MAQNKAFGIIDVPARIPGPAVLHGNGYCMDGLLVLDLPLPPSVNRTSGQRLGNEHPLVKQWRKSADAYLLFTRQSKHLKLIDGTVMIEIIWSGQMIGDIDNRIKHLLDYLQRLGVIANDSWCRRLLADYGTAPAGCRVRVHSWRQIERERIIDDASCI